MYLIDMVVNKTEHRVKYADTDHFGVAYYGRYLEWFEVGRTEILRENGVTYAELEKKGLFAPVVEVKVNYKKPAKYDEVVNLETSISHIGNSSIRFDYKLVNQKDELVAEGHTVNVFIDKEMNPVRIPNDVRDLLK